MAHGMQTNMDTHITSEWGVIDSLIKFKFLPYLLLSTQQTELRQKITPSLSLMLLLYHKLSNSLFTDKSSSFILISRRNILTFNIEIP